jgi:hypothetical protein
MTMLKDVVNVIINEGNASELAKQYITERAREILAEKQWSADVDTKWTPPEGLFTKSADEIAKTLRSNSESEAQAMSRLNFYINRAGKNLSAEDKQKLETVKAKLKAEKAKKRLAEGKPHTQ